VSSEDLRAYRAAKSFRLSVLGGNEQPEHRSEALIKAAEEYTGYRCEYLPPNDPLLAGANAMLDRDFEVIWQRDDLPKSMQLADAAHEFGHLVLHSPIKKRQDEFELNELVGYSENERDERDAHRFAAEFLLPRAIALRLFNNGKRCSQIAFDLLLPKNLVVRQLIAAFDPPSSKPLISSAAAAISLDQWQSEAATAQSPAIVLGGPGTGKTAVLIARCRYLVEECELDPRRVRIVTHSLRAADELRFALLTSDIANGALICISTPGQIAYDILVKFRGLVGIDQAAKERTSFTGGTNLRFIRSANSLLIQDPSIVSLIGRRFSHTLVDNFDEMIEDARRLLLTVEACTDLSIWLTAGSRWSPKDVPQLSTPKVYRLHRQYRIAKRVHNFITAFIPTHEKKEVSCRRVDDRCDEGSVRIAVAQAAGQVASGIAAYMQQMEDAGYRRDEIAIICHNAVAQETVAELKNLNLHRASPVNDYDDKYLYDLVSFASLCVADWSALNLFRVGRLPEYDLRPDQLGLLVAEVSREKQFSGRIRKLLEYCNDDGGKRLAGHLVRCQKATSVRDILRNYLFEMSDFLCHAPSAGAAVRRLFNRLPKSPIGSADEQFSQLLDRLKTAASTCGANGDEMVRILSSSAQVVSKFPIVVAVGVDLLRMHNTLPNFKGGGGPSSDVGVAWSAEDHLLYCVVSKTPRRAFALANGISKAVGQVDVLDWSALPLPKIGQPENSVIGEDEIENRLVAQCPRRLYYHRALQKQTVPMPLMLSDSYPAQPVDAALCQTCQYFDLCPTIIC
jgi:hypothetical protein